MTTLLEKIAAGDTPVDPQFPHAPEGWSVESARQLAEAEGLALGDEHLAVLRSLHEYFARHREGAAINLRELHDALDERFHREGGMKQLYRLFPRGPVAQGCRLAGLPVPAGAIDRGFGSVA